MRIIISKIKDVTGSDGYIIQSEKDLAGTFVPAGEVINYLKTLL